VTLSKLLIGDKYTAVDCINPKLWKKKRKTREEKKREREK